MNIDFFYFKDVDKLPDYITFKEMEGSPLDELFPAAGKDLVEVLETLLAINPIKRLNCTKTLQLPYFR